MRYVSIPPLDVFPVFTFMLVVACVELACVVVLVLCKRSRQVSPPVRCTSTKLIALPFIRVQLLATYALLGTMLGIMGLHYLLGDPLQDFKGSAGLVALLMLRISVA